MVNKFFRGKNDKSYIHNIHQIITSLMYISFVGTFRGKNQSYIHNNICEIVSSLGVHKLQGNFLRKKGK
jgi:hypothetical protein